MRYESDYIMRMIQLFRLLLEHLAGITEPEKLSLGEAEIENALQIITGLGWSEVEYLSEEQLSEMLGTQGEGPLRLSALARLLCIRADFHERLGKQEHCRAFRRRALRLYLAADCPPEALRDSYAALRDLGRRFLPELSDEECRKLGRLYERAGYYADAEDAFCAQAAHEQAQAFYERLLCLDDGELARGGLPRGEVAQGLARIARLRGER